MSKLIELEQKDWLKLYVAHVVYNFSNKFDIKFSPEDIDIVCKEVADMNLPEGVDAFYVMMLLIEGKETQLHIDSMIGVCEIKGLTLGLDMLVYMYSQISEGRGYDSEVAFIFKNCIQHIIPF